MELEMLDIKVSGKLIAENEPVSLENKKFNDLVSVTQHTVIQLEQNRGDDSLVALKQLDKNDVIELEFEGGLTQWIRLEDFKERTNSASRGEGGEIIITPDSFRQQTAIGDERGDLIGLALKFLKVLKIDPIKDLAGLSIAALTEHFEQKHIAQPGIYQYQGNGLDNLVYRADDTEIDIDTQQPVLLFIHGTFSSSKGSFADLWAESNAAYLQKLLAPYGQQIFFLEHHTLSVSPIRNAIDAVSLFPIGTKFHIISHSRGGLVGELLCQGKLKRRTAESNGEYLETDKIFLENELHVFKKEEARKQEYRDLKELQQLLQAREISVERFVRIAAPANGTLLASNGIEEAINTSYNILKLIPVPQLIGVLEFLKILLLAIIKQGKQADVLPGIECMVPTSPLIALLNRRSVQLQNELTIIAGEVAGTGFIARLKKWIANKIFDEEHDFIINTSAMYGGCLRAEGASRYYLAKGVDASHFKYFQNKAVKARIKEALQNPLGTLGMFLPLQALLEDYQSESRSDEVEKQASLYFIPGVFGSALSVKDAPVWMDLAALQWGDFSKLRFSQAGVKTDGLVTGIYEPILAYLSASHNIIPFSYDWRRSYLLAGRRLGEQLQQHLDKIKASGESHTIRILAHSSGGLVVKAMMLEYADVWEELNKTTDCQIVMLGSPLAGSHRIIQLLLGQHRINKLMQLLESRDDVYARANQFAEYPGILELLPRTLGDYSYFSKDKWREELLPQELEQWSGFAGLDNAKSVAQQLDSVDISQTRICYIAGQSNLTPISASNTTGETEFIASQRGDCFTHWNSVKLSPEQLWFIPVEHGKLVNYRPSFKGILDLLQSANTQQLSHTLPRIEEEESNLPKEIPSLYPNEQELLAASLCFSTKNSEQEIETKVDIRVVHGNLEHVNNVIVVGHYDGDSIVNAEHVLDQRLNGRMRELQRLGMYPGEINSSKVLFNPQSKPSGAIVVGLGNVGKLTAGDLLDTYTHALLDYALLVRDHQQAEQSDDDFEPISLNISSLLVGSGFGGLQVTESIMAILRAVKRANKALKKNHQGRVSAIASLEFVELYEDKAIETIKFLKKIANHFEYKKDFFIHSHLACIPGGNRRVMFSEQTGWWQRMQIEGNAKGVLKYITLTDQARAEAELQPTQSKLVNKFVEVATKDTLDNREVGKTLFELLVPNSLKDHTHDLDNLVLVLNDKSAGLPWELLQNRLDVGAEPISVSAGMLRQLQTSQYREVVINPSNRTALVVGNPPTKKFIDLKAATKEAKAVSKQLTQQGFEVNTEIKTSARSILNALHTSDYRVLHLAGHGVFNYDANGKFDEPVTGMVLGDDIFLTPVEIRQMRKVPEFAFINCCHLGKVKNTPSEAWKDRHKLAANLASELIRMGVRAIVAAGWAINDSAAALFSSVFYNCLLKGSTFGESVMEARRQTYHQYKESNTWGAYQCYGDPDYVLTHHAASDTSNTIEEQQYNYYFASDSEVIVELQNLSNSADSARVSHFSDLQNKLSSIEAAIPVTWLNKADIRMALGRAHGKLDNFESAIKHYEFAKQAPQANYSVAMLEDMVSLKTAWALKLGDKEETHDKALVLIDESLSLLDLLDKLGHSTERWQERGKAWKRKALIVKGRSRSIALRHMEEAYQKAHEMAFEQNAMVDPYPLVNWQTCKVIRHFRNNKNPFDKSELIYWLNQARQEVDARNDDEASFCTGITLAECTILSYIIETDDMSKTEIINKTVDYYSQAIARGAAPRQIRFVAEHLRFLICMLVNPKYRNNIEVDKIVKVLKRILEMLRGSL